MNRFDNVDTSSLTSSCSSILSKISYDKIKEINENLSNENIWSCQAKNNLKMAMQSLILYYTRLEDDFKILQEIAADITEYKQKAQTLKYVNSSLSHLRQNRYTTVFVNGRYRRQLNQSVVSQISDLTVQKNVLTREMRQLLNNIRNYNNQIK